MRLRRKTFGLALVVALVAGMFTAASGGTATATDAGPAPAPDITKLKYAPIGHFKPGDPVPAPDDPAALRQLMSGGVFNPSGNFNAFDTNVFETLVLPYRASGDLSASDPDGNGGDSRHGYCAFNPDNEKPGDLALVAGDCPNHQLEYSRYFENTMKHILGPYGATVRRYRFFHGATGNTEGGVAINTAAIVPGTLHPEETIIISGHYDQTTEGPASTWDSAEGHAQVIRVAKLMADYWKATGTRPAATVIFVPWDAEEAGTRGSLNYVQNNIVPGQEMKVRGYFNTDPCAGGYPAYRLGDPADRIQLGIQLMTPPAAGNPNRDRVLAFNEMSRRVVEEVFDNLDDTVTTVDGTKRHVFVSTAEGGTSPVGGAQSDIAPEGTTDPTSRQYGVNIGFDKPLLFSSDWRNFEAVGIPFFNPGPEVTGPSNQGAAGNPDGLAILHTPNDNIPNMNVYTGQLDGDFSEAWIKGMEMCAHLLAWGMLQPEMAESRPAADTVVAYYEALPNEAAVGKPVRFDADGSYQLIGQRGVSRNGLTYTWDFGDGTGATSRKVQHVYDSTGTFVSTLTVRAPNGQTDTMTVPIVVGEGSAPPLPGPVLQQPPSEDADGTFKLTWNPVSGGPLKYQVEESAGAQVLFTDDAESLDGWTVEPPTEPKIKPWQESDSSTTKVRGNIRHGGERSFWTGIAVEDQEPAVGPGEGVSSLTLDEPIQLPAGRSTILSYWSDFANDANDFARVDVAVDDGSGGPLEWSTVDEFGRASQDRYTVAFQEMGTESGANFERRRVDLGGFAGKSIRLRFSLILGAAQFVNVFRTGWYVDDIQLEAAPFRLLGGTTATEFTIANRPPGDYAYRVRALYETGELTDYSNIVSVKVTG